MAAIEYAFNVYPSTPLSSTVLHLAHAVVLGGVFRADARWGGEVRGKAL